MKKEKWFKTGKQWNLNARLLIVFFCAIFLLSVVHLLVYSQLFATMAREEVTLNTERITNAAEKLDMAMSGIKQSYMLLKEGESAYVLKEAEPSVWQGGILHKKATNVLDTNRYIEQWMFFFPQAQVVVGTLGHTTLEQYVTRFCRSDDYPVAFWQEMIADNNAAQYYSGSQFGILQTNGSHEDRYLLPFVIKAYGKNPVTTVLLLNMKTMAEECDNYLSRGFYIFSPQGSLLYTTDSAPMVTELPEGASVTAADGNVYAVQRYTNADGLQYIKLLPEKEATGILQGSLLLSIAAVLLSVLAAIVLVLPVIKKATHPVEGMMKLLQEHASLENINDLKGAHSELEQILKSREEQAAALAQKEAALSRYFLQSKLKNVYVDMENVEDREERTAYILYIQIQYRETMRGFFSMTRAELENCLQEMLSGTLNRLFETTMIFQLEPGRFAAKVTLPLPETQMGDRMEKFLKRLENEQEFAGFTVVQSEPLGSDTDLAAVYSQVQEASRHALVGENLQLLTLPLDEKIGLSYVFVREDSQKLHDQIHEGQTEAAAKLAVKILQENLRRGISHAQMAALCVSIVNAAAYAMTEIAPGAEKIAAASGVYSTLTTRCITIWDYIDTVTGFIRSAAATGDVREQSEVEDDDLLGRIQQYLRKNYQKDLSGEQIAEALWVSRSYLSSYYKSKTGMNLSDSIQLFRIQKATELLKDPQIRVGDVGALVGISSQNTFLRQFKKYTGLTPREYRLRELEHKSSLREKAENGKN